MPQRLVSTMPSSITFTDSLVRAKPASRNMKPACMKNTRNAVTSTHIVLIGLTYGESAGTAAIVTGAGLAAGAAAGVAAADGDAAAEAAGEAAAAGESAAAGV